MTAKFPPVALPDTPFAAAVRETALALPGAYEDYPWSTVVYKVRERLFVMMGGSDPFAITVKATHDDADILTGLPHIERARYVGRHGWVTVTVSDDATLDHARDLIVASYELVSKPARGRRRAATSSHGSTLAMRNGRHFNPAPSSAPARKYRS